MNPEKTIIRIPEPCHEDWKDMTPTEKGAFCKSCAKEVKDFSRSSKTEIIAALSEASGSVCGRFRPDQVARPQKETRLIDLLPASATKVAKVAATLSAAFFTVDAVQAQTGNVRLGKFIAHEQAEVQAQTILEGSVIDEHGAVIADAHVHVVDKDQEAIETMTDKKGRFTLSLVRSNLGNTTIDITVSDGDRMPILYKDFKLDRSKIKLEVKMDSPFFLIGEIESIEPEESMIEPIEANQEGVENSISEDSKMMCDSNARPQSQEKHHAEIDVPQYLGLVNIDCTIEPILIGDTILTTQIEDLPIEGIDSDLTTPIAESTIELNLDLLAKDVRFTTGFCIVSESTLDTHDVVAEPLIVQPIRPITKSDTTPTVPIEPESALSVVVYPNPTTERLFVISSENKRTDFVIIDANGRVVLSAVTTGELSEVDVSALKNGTYLLRYMHSTTPLSKRFVVKR